MRQDILSKIIDQLAGAFGEVVYGAGDDFADLLDVSGGFGAGVGKLADFLCDNGKALACLSGACGLDGGIDGN